MQRLAIIVFLYLQKNLTRIQPDKNKIKANLICLTIYHIWSRAHAGMVSWWAKKSQIFLFIKCVVRDDVVEGADRAAARTCVG